MDTPHADTAEVVTAQFLPLHKRAFGVALGVTAAVVMFLMTAIFLVRQPVEPRLQLELLSHFFAGYTVSWVGAFVGAAWAGFAGYIFGWFFAFCRNLALGIMLINVRARANVAEHTGYLDHI